MASTTNKLDSEELDAWLNRQLKEASVATATRSALSVLPLLHEEVGGKRLSDATILPVFRTTSIAFCYIDTREHTKEQLVHAPTRTRLKR